MLVPPLIPQPAIEALGVRVPVPLPWLDQPQLNPLSMRPHHHRLAGGIGTVVRPDYLKLAPQRTDSIEQRRQVLDTHRMLDRHGYRLVRHVIDHRQACRRPSNARPDRTRIPSITLRSRKPGGSSVRRSVAIRRFRRLR